MVIENVDAVNSSGCVKGAFSYHYPFSKRRKKKNNLTLSTFALPIINNNNK